ncbi:MAG: pirin family protein, partial [Anaerolineales bacterium]
DRRGRYDFMLKVREIDELVQPQTVIEGAGVRLLRSFGPSRQNPLDPFLLFDHFAFNDPIQGPIAGFPQHPHRGIETVTYMLEGNTRHRDSLGNMGVIGPGDVQWMTSGSGILHEEMPRRGPDGRVRGFQLWVNLPRAEKMGRPRYQEVKADEIPSVETEGTLVRVVAGTYDAIHGPVAEIAAKPIYLDVELTAGTRFELPVPAGHRVVAYLFEGAAAFGDSDDLVEAVCMILLEDGDLVRAAAGPDGSARFMLMAGRPFGEPIVPYGPFVMNTEDEIRQAISELRSGTFVKEGAGWSD